MGTLESSIKLLNRVKKSNMESNLSSEGSFGQPGLNRLCSQMASDKVLSELQNLLKRVSKGLSSSFAAVENELKSAKAQFQKYRVESSSAYTALSASFEQFKADNSLDEYFAKGLTDETRETVLKLVADLENTESEDYLSWQETLRAFHQ